MRESEAREGKEDRQLKMEVLTNFNGFLLHILALKPVSAVEYWSWNIPLTYHVCALDLRCEMISIVGLKGA